MRITGISLFLILSVSLGAAPGTNPIDTTINRMEYAQNIAGAMSKLSELHAWPDRKFVVVHFGDSHIQGDNFSGQIRRNLQAEFGNGGEGILFPYSLCKSFGPKSLISSSTGVWTWSTVLKNNNQPDVGVTGYTLKTQDTSASLTFRYQQDSTTKDCSQVSFWYGGGNATVFLKNSPKGVTMEEDETLPQGNLHRMIIRGYQQGTDLTFKFKKQGHKSGFDFSFYGIEYERESGVEYHRCGVVGATFLQLTSQDDITLDQLKAIKPDLIIFSYGSNESYNSSIDRDVYTSQIARYIRGIKSYNPNVNVVITSPPDTRSGGRYPVNTQWICDSLKKICDYQGCSFWDMHSIMGGDGSITFWLNNSLARKDKLHFTRAGYELQGDLFSQALLNSYKETYTLEEVPVLKLISERITSQLSGLNASGTATSPAQTGNEKVHTVKQGETLSSIARDNKVTVDQLCQWNSIKKTDVLRIGQELKIQK